MPCSYLINNGLLKYNACGQFNTDEICRTIEESLIDPHFIPGMNVIVDITGSTTKRSSQDVRIVADFLGSKHKFRGSQVAVAVSQPVYYSFGSMLSFFLEDYGITINVFKNVEDAEQWINSVYWAERNDNDI